MWTITCILRYAKIPVVGKRCPKLQEPSMAMRTVCAGCALLSSSTKYERTRQDAKVRVRPKLNHGTGKIRMWWLIPRFRILAWSQSRND
jgi:hypothetical protein